MNPILMDKESLINEMMARERLRRYIPADKRRTYGEYAWEKGQETACLLYKSYPGQTPGQMAQQMGLTVTDEDGPGFYFSEYSPRMKQIVLFKNTIQNRFIDSEQEHLACTDYSKVRQLFLAHELFHHLECSNPHVGITHKEKKVTVFSAGPFQWTSGLRCLSEIAAHSFALRITGEGIVYYSQLT